VRHGRRYRRRCDHTRRLFADHGRLLSFSESLPLAIRRTLQG
jgi:hypothetical protein